MRRVSLSSLARSIARPLLAVMACSPLWFAGPALSATLAGPSVVKPAQTVQFKGSGFAPDSVVTISVSAPGVGEAHYSVVVDTDGSLTYEFSPATTGTYVLSVLDGEGQALATTQFLATE